MTPRKLYTKNKGNYFSTGAYIINKDGAKQLLNYSSKYILNQNINHTADEYLISSTNTYVYKHPMFIYGTNETSTIHPEHILMHNNSKSIIQSLLYQ
jgi:GR25 family glycosyltransferase involved in LPS biosynthesis